MFGIDRLLLSLGFIAPGSMPTMGSPHRMMHSFSGAGDPERLSVNEFKGVLMDSMEVPTSELDRVLARTGPALGIPGGDRDDGGGFATGLGSPYPPCPTAAAALRGSVHGGSGGNDPCPTWQEPALAGPGSRGGDGAGRHGGPVLLDSLAHDGYEPAPLAAPSPYAPGYRGTPQGDVTFRGGFGAPTFVGPAPKPPFVPSNLRPAGDQMLLDAWAASERSEMPPIGQVFSLNRPMPKAPKPQGPPEMLLEG